jgi:hypothetical protein
MPSVTGQQHGGAEQVVRPRGDERLEGGLVVGVVPGAHRFSLPRMVISRVP